MPKPKMKKIKTESERFYLPASYRFVVIIGTWVIHKIVCLILFTCRIEVYGEKKEMETRQRFGSANYVTWHRSLVYNMFHGRRRFNGPYSPVGLASRSKDGEIAARTAKHMGYVVSRGSSSKHGKEALREMAGLVNQGYDSAILCDAPTGPAQRCKFGAVVLAARTGKPVIPSISTAYPCWRLKSWDGLIIPKPFARVVLILDTQHLNIPVDANRETIELYRKLLEDIMNKRAYQADYYVKFPRKYKSPFNVPVPKNYLGANWDPFLHSINRGKLI